MNVFEKLCISQILAEATGGFNPQLSLLSFKDGFPVVVSSPNWRPVGRTLKSRREYSKLAQLGPRRRLADLMLQTKASETKHRNASPALSILQAQT
jgi:hypothetical protein